jgi:pyruvate formate lyase activating enzyme
MPPQGNAFSSSIEIPKPDLSFGDSRIDALPAPRFLPATVDPLAELPDRRFFLKAMAFPCAAACVIALARNSFALSTGNWGGPGNDDSRYRVEARFYEKLPDKMVRCKLCPRECVVAQGSRGYCRVRENDKGTYYTLVHSRIVSAHVDPIEKKPFFHFLPGHMAFSVATAGCNVNCKFCQNWEISQARPEDLPAQYLPPKELASLAGNSRCAAVSFTYNEPTIFNEYVTDAAEAARDAGLKSVVVTNGFIQQAPLKRVCQRADGIKIDLKAFSADYYRNVVDGQLQPILDTLITIRKQGRWLEIVYLTVPTLNDHETEIRDMSRWIKAELGPDVPVHFTRFHPLYLLKNLPPTPVETLERCKAVADAEGLHYVYVGNVPGHPAENTYCPKCHKLVIERAGFTVTQMNLHKGKCQYCQNPIPGVWS